MRRSIRLFNPAAIGALALALQGCAAVAPAFAPAGPPTSPTATPIPLVQNCAVLFTGTPSRFACNGKVYTSFQLAKLREDEAKRYASGK